MESFLSKPFKLISFRLFDFMARNISVILFLISIKLFNCQRFFLKKNISSVCLLKHVSDFSKLSIDDMKVRKNTNLFC